MKQALFNSLGSNYSGRFIFKSVFGGGSAADRRRFEKVLSEHYHGQTTLTYKGREALELALTISSLPAGSAVGINSFTCYVVYRAVENAGYKPVFIDVAPNDMHFGLKELKSIAKHTKLAAVIVQNTLGYPADMTALKPYCDKQNIQIIEDCAHSLGALYADGLEVGTFGNLAMFSFSQDKPLDVVAGGALINRHQTKQSHTPKVAAVGWWQREVNRDYPFWTALIRKTYPSGVGRIIHYILKRVHFLAGPMQDAGPGLHTMSPRTARLALARWEERDSELAHRRTIAKIYEQNIPQQLQLVKKSFGQPSYLRFPLATDKRASLIAYLKRQRIYIGDTWYDAPLAPKRYMPQTSYQTGVCPQAEQLVERIVNLPTHINISQDQAADIARKVIAWHESQ